MFGMEELKESIEITEKTVECPVKNCSEKVERQRKDFKREKRFKCPKHNIYISPTTFEYQSESDNLLWKDKADSDLLEKIKKVKRESRITRDNSEDAVTWNVFRFLERNNLIEKTLNSIIGITLKSSEIIYWSYSQKEEYIWSELDKARKEFEINPKKGSEPDIIIKTSNTLLFIEAKLTANNNTRCKSKKPEVQEKYESGGGNWFSKVFKSNYETVARNKCELMRFWLLGTWIAKRLDLDFYLVNLVLSKREKDIETIFKRYIYETQRRRFIRISWEDIYYQIRDSNLSKIDIDKDMMIKYFKNKTIGYNGNRRLQKALSIS